MSTTHRLQSNEHVADAKPPTWHPPAGLRLQEAPSALAKRSGDLRMKLKSRAASAILGDAGHVPWHNRQMTAKVSESSYTAAPALNAKIPGHLSSMSRAEPISSEVGKSFGSRGADRPQAQLSHEYGAVDRAQGLITPVLSDFSPTHTQQLVGRGARNSALESALVQQVQTGGSARFAGEASLQIENVSWMQHANETSKVAAAFSAANGLPLQVSSVLDPATQTSAHDRSALSHPVSTSRSPGLKQTCHCARRPFQLI